MSADNGIYILSTPKGDGFEYRVKHLQAVENVYWDGTKETDNERVIIENARVMWANCKVYTNKAEAYREADKIEKNCSILEYGIRTIKINKEF